MLHVGIVAGESSGDQLGAGLITAIREHVPDAVFEGIGGDRMIALGCKSLYPSDILSIVGLIEVIGRYNELKRIRSSLIQHFIDNPPDIFIGIDVPDFNLGLERKLKEAGIKTIQYVSPQVWAWRRYRVKKIARSVDEVLALFPFEEEFYQHHQVNVKYVGHPLADMLPLEADKHAARARLDLSRDGPLVAILPGSRISEVKHLGEIFVKAAEWCWQQQPDLQFVVPLASPLIREMFVKELETHGQNLPVTLLGGDSGKDDRLDPGMTMGSYSREAMAASDLVMLASGTATLEALLLKRPMVVAYRFSWINYLIAKLLVKVKNCSLPNLLADEELVPEFVQLAATPENLGQAVMVSLRNPGKRAQLVEKFSTIHRNLRQDTNHKAAEAVLALANP